MINIGIIGAGRSGWELHAGPLQHMEGFSVVAICDATPARLARVAAAFPVQTYNDGNDLIADRAVDVVVVAVPNSLHAHYALAALDAGKHVIVEKPMAVALAEADAMMAAAQKARRTLVTFHNRHWDSDYQMVKAVVRRGDLGDILTIEARVMTYTPEWITYGAPEWNPAWRVQAAYGGGMLNDWGPHLLEQCLDLMDEWPSKVSCQQRRDIWSTEVDDYFSLRMWTPSGKQVTVEASNSARLPPPRWFVVGREGTLVADGTWGNWTNIQVRRNLDGVSVDALPQASSPAGSARNMAVSDTLSSSFYRDFAEALATGRPPEIPAARSRDTIAIIEAARRSAATGEVVAPAAAKGSYGRG